MSTIEFQEYTLSDMIKENGLEVEQVFPEETIEAVADAVQETVQETVQDVVAEAVQDAVQETVVEAVQDAVAEAVEPDVVETVTEAVEGGVNIIEKPINEDDDDKSLDESSDKSFEEPSEDNGKDDIKYIESNFVKQLRNQIERIKEIISYPSVAACYKDALTNIFTSIDSMVDSYPNVSFKTISKQIINSVDYDLYQNKFKDEFKDFYSMNYNIKHALKPEELKMFNKKTLPTLRYSLQNLFDELQENIDLSMDRYNLTFFDKEKIYNYFTLKAEIEDMFEELILDVKNYEKEMVEYAHLLTEHVKKEVMPSLYHNHQILSLQSMNTKKPKIKQCNYFNKQLNEYFKQLCN